MVTSVGSHVSTFNVGDRVVGFCFDNFATYQRTPATFLHKIADAHSFPVSPNAMLQGRSLILQGGGDITDGFCRRDLRPQRTRSG